MVGMVGSLFVEEVGFCYTQHMAPKGSKLSDEHKAHIGDALRGKPKSEAHKAALKANHKGRTGKKNSSTHTAALVASRIGRKHTSEAKTKMREAKLGALVGSRNPNWKGGITPINGQVRGSPEYKQWSKAVLERDNFTCQMCGKRGGNLNADHIQSFAQHPDLRFDISNGRTLCVPCHKTSTKARKQYSSRRII
jgi:hypothetical protein